MKHEASARFGLEILMVVVVPLVVLIGGALAASSMYRANAALLPSVHTLAPSH
ncbi:hypothetical protein [Solimonas marina]|uniref:Uncharacterized protein n=1 Tax=Solimonas marina TaxID=2714601 RepID=A0A969W9Y7_9GAMM|nr:hypothetical protein [Solimonas marina]NKF23486.1 hypothetical protein [Solimonas marina]